MSGSIPYYRGKNLFGIATDFIANPPEFVERMEPVLGDFYRVKIPSRRLYVTTRPEIFRFVLQSHARLFQKSVIYREMKRFLGEGLLTSEGEHWRRQRRLAQPVFYKKYLGQLFDTMERQSASYVDQLRERAGAGVSADIAMEMMQVTSDIVMQALFTAQDDEDKQNTYAAITFFQEAALQRVYKPYYKVLHRLDGSWRRYQRLKKEMDDRMFELIRRRRQEQDPPNDLLSMLLASRYEDTGEAMADEQLRDELVTMYLAGHETSATALSWTLYLLARHPEVVTRLREERDAVAGEGPLRPDHLPRLVYGKQVLEEGMRLYPPAYIISRRLKEDAEIEGISVPGGSTLYMSIYGLHRSSRYWEDPGKFDPDRFSPERSSGRPTGVYMPFGAGARMCIGNQFALMEMLILLSYLIQHLDFHLEEGHPIETQPLITLKPKYGIRMRIQAR